MEDHWPCSIYYDVQLSFGDLDGNEGCTLSYDNLAVSCISVSQYYWPVRHGLYVGG